MENENQNLAVESSIMTLKDFIDYEATTTGTFTNINSPKEIYNLSHNVDCKLNDCAGEKLRITKVLIRRFKKELEEAKVNEATGESYDVEFPLSCVIVDDNGKSYATGSKIFAFNLVDYIIRNGGIKDLENGGIELEIVKNPLENGRSSLGFKVL